MVSVGVSRETERDFKTYLRLLSKWQHVKNLVAPSTLEEAHSRHIVDSLQLIPLAPKDTRRWIDLGSGAGFPGLVAAIHLKDVPGARVDLIESDHRKCAFLRAVARETGSPTVVHFGRIEDILPTLDVPDTISARALAPLSKLVEWGGPMIEKGATGLFLKGRDVGVELTEMTKYSSLQYRLVPSMTASDAAVVVVTAGLTPHTGPEQ